MKHWIAFVLAAALSGVLSGREVEDAARVHLHASVPLCEVSGAPGVRAEFTTRGLPEDLHGKVLRISVKGEENGETWKAASFRFVPLESGNASLQLFAEHPKGKKYIYGTLFDEVRRNGELLPGGDFESASHWQFRADRPEEERRFPARLTADPGVVKFGRQCAVTGSFSRAITTIPLEKGKPVEISFRYRNIGRQEFDGEVLPVDVSGAANMGYADERAGDGRGGWSDQGPELDLSGFDSSFHTFGGMSFRLLPAEKSDAKTVLTFDSQYCRTGLKSAVLPVDSAEGGKRWLYLLHSSCWTPDNTGIGTLLVTYADGLKSEFEIVSGRDIADWCNEGASNARKVYGRPNKHGQGGFFLSRFPLAGKPVASLTLTTSGRSVWIVLGATLSSREVVLETADFTPDASWKPADFPDIRVAAGSAIDFTSQYEAGPAGRYGRARVSPRGGLEFEKLPGVDQRFFGIGVWDGGAIAQLGNVKKKVRIDALDVKNYYFKFGEWEKHVPLFLDLMLRQGYNAMRIGPVPDNRDLENYGPIPEFLDFFDYLLAEAKKRGIYSYLNLGIGSDGYRYYRTDQSVNSRFALTFGDPATRERWKRNAAAVLNHVNPYTGIAWKEEPSILVLEFHNELELGIAYAQRLKPENRQRLLKRWQSWLQQRYTTPEALNRAWGSRPEQKSFADVKLSASTWNNRPETRDWAEFSFELLSECQRWCASVVRELGYRGLVTQYNCGKELRHNRLRAECSDAVSLNTYFSHPIGGWGEAGTQVRQHGSIEQAGPQFRTAASARIAGRPLLLTEHNHCNWNRYQYEAGLLLPAYSALQNFSAMFVHGPAVLETRSSWQKYLRPFDVYNSPLHRAAEFLGACLFGRGDVKASSHLVELEVSDKFLNASSPGSAVNSEQNKLALLCGFGVRMTDVSFTSGSGKQPPSLKPILSLSPENGAQTRMELYFSEVASAASGEFRLEKAVENLRAGGILSVDNRTDVAAGRFESDTGEIMMDVPYNQLTVSTAKTEAAALAANSRVKFKVLSIDGCTNNAVLALTSMDGKPLTESERMILVCATEELNSGIRLTSDRVTLLDPGRYPVLLKCCRFKVGMKLKAGRGYQLYPLSVNGVRRAPLPLTQRNGQWFAEVDTATLPEGPTVFFELVAKGR